MTTVVLAILIYAGVLGLAVLLLRWLDQLHARKAWRDAGREARDIMRRRQMDR